MIKLLVFPIYTRCSGNNCRVIHLNRITGNSYYTDVRQKNTKPIKEISIDCEQYKKSGTLGIDKDYSKMSDEELLFLYKCTQ